MLMLGLLSRNSQVVYTKIKLKAFCGIRNTLIDFLSLYHKAVANRNFKPFFIYLFFYITKMFTYRN